MAYATQDDIIASHGADQLLLVPDRDNDGEIDAPAVTRALAEATALIDTLLGGRYPVPLPVVPDLVRGICIDIALYKLASIGGGLHDELRTRYDDAISLLKRIADGKAALDIPVTPPASDGDVQFESPQRHFTRDSMRGW